MNAHTARGFSFVEVIVSMAIVLAVTGAMFGLVDSARRIVEADLERSDMHQRARVTLDALFRDLVMAGAGGRLPAVAPLRRGDINPDLSGSAYADRLSIQYVPPDAAATAFITITYALHIDAAGVTQLTRYDGHATDLPVADHVEELRFEYFDAAAQPIALGRFIDGPWTPDAVAAERFDADLESVRRVRATVRVRPARAFAGIPLADLHVTLDVSPRNLNLQ